MAIRMEPTQKALNKIPRPLSGEVAIAIRVIGHPGVEIRRGRLGDSFILRACVKNQRITETVYKGSSIRTGLKLVQEARERYQNGFTPKAGNMSYKEAADLYVQPQIKGLKDSKGALSKQNVLMNLPLADGRRTGSLTFEQLQSRDSVDAIVAAAQIGRSQATVKRLLSRHSKNLSILVDKGFLDANPCERVKLPKENNRRKRTLTPEETILHVRKALALGTPHGHSQALAGAIGCRIGEAISLRWGDITPDGRMIVLSDSKNGEPAIYPLNNAAREILKQCEQWKINDFVFPSTVRAEGYIAYPRESFTKIRDEVMAEAGTKGALPPYWLHDFRRSFASTCNYVNGDLRATQQLLNHKSCTTTERYTFHVPTQLSEASERTAQALFGDLYNELTTA